MKSNINKKNDEEYYQNRQEQTSLNKYINFKINGRLFPTWVMANFKKYKLPPIIRTAGEDPCKLKKGEKFELRKYQMFISKFLDYKSQYKDILVYHGLGAGKSSSVINIYNMLYNYTPGWNVFLLIKASLRDHPWMTEIKKWLTSEEYEYRFKNIIFVHYDSPFADKNFLDAMKTVDSSKKNMYIIDEVHNFIRNVYSNISTRKGKRAQVIYDYIIQDKKENRDTRTVLMSASPAINKPFELALLFNLLRPGIFPRSENKFDELYITSAMYKTINSANKNMFQRRITGLVSFYVGAGANPGVYAKKKMNYVDVPMSKYQTDIYSYYEEIEAQIAKRARLSKGTGGTVYKSYTRQACNFVFPHISQRVTGEDRPRPSKFRITEREAEALSSGSDKIKHEKGSESYLNINLYTKALKLYIQSFSDLLYKQNASDLAKNHTIHDDTQTFIKKYNRDFNKFVTKEKKFSNLFMIMYKCSAKMSLLTLNIMSSPGPVLVYSNYVMMEGLEILKIYLKYFGFTHYKSEGQQGFKYAEFHGGVSREDRKAGLDEYNKKENIDGSVVKAMLVSPAGSEGLSLENTRQVHIMEPYWHEVRIFQMIGRAIRLCSHKNLPMDQRSVEVYRYRSTRKGGKWTADQQIEDIARSKESLIQSFLNTMKEAAVDCNLNLAHNSTVEEYKCFQYSEDSLFDKYIGPAYKQDINDDMRIDNGSSSVDHTVVKIKVMKIKAVMLLSSEEETKVKYSKPTDYWYFSKSGVAYDFESKYPVGKISTDSDGIPNKLDKDTYIIDYVIPIPIITGD